MTEYLNMPTHHVKKENNTPLLQQKLMLVSKVYEAHLTRPSLKVEGSMH
jgi:hypothetical protein